MYESSASKARRRDAGSRVMHWHHFFNCELKGEVEMNYRQLIKKVQYYSGFSDEESKDALDGTVATIALHLTEGERKDFASQLPIELRALAMSVYVTDEAAKRDILEQFTEVQGVKVDRAKKQLLSSWRAIKDAISIGEIRHIQAQLPARVRTRLLY